MSDMGSVGEVLQAAVASAHEGMGYVDMGEEQRQRLVAEYAGFAATFENIMDTAATIKEILTSTVEYAQVGGEKIHEGAQQLRTLDTQNSTVHSAVRHYDMAAGIAALGEGSMVNDAAVQGEVLDEITGHLHTAKETLDNLMVMLSIDGAKAVRVHVEGGDDHAAQYAAEIGVPPPVV